MLAQLIAEGSSKLASVPSGGGGGGAAAPGAAAGGAAPEAAKEEAKEEGTGKPPIASMKLELIYNHHREGGVRRRYGLWPLRLRPSHPIKTISYWRLPGTGVGHLWAHWRRYWRLDRFAMEMRSTGLARLC